jgi:hypothetical protein
MTDHVAAARAALCRAPHRFEWWAMERAWMSLVQDNYFRHLRGEPLWTCVQEKHYAFLSEARQP